MRFVESTCDTDREGIVDAVTRVVEGIDFADEELLRSAFTDDAVFDLSGIDPSVGSFTPYVGKDVVVSTLMQGVATRMDTFHVLGNIRVRIDGDCAALTCYLYGQHHRPGEGPSLATQDFMLLGNRFETELVRDHGHRWLIRRNTITSRFALGNAAAVH